MWEVQIALIHLPAKMCQGLPTMPEGRKKQRRTLSWRLRRQQPYWCLDSGLLASRTPERINFCCFKSLNLQYFVTAAQRNLNTLYSRPHCCLPQPTCLSAGPLGHPGSFPFLRCLIQWNPNWLIGFKVGSQTKKKTSSYLKSCGWFLKHHSLPSCLSGGQWT